MWGIIFMSDGYREMQQYALCLVQALIGVISPNFRLVAVSRQFSRIVVKIVLAEYNEEDIHEIEDMKTEFEAVLSQPVNFEFQVVVSTDVLFLDPPSDQSMVVFMRRE